MSNAREWREGVAPRPGGVKGQARHHLAPAKPSPPRPLRVATECLSLLLWFLGLILLLVALSVFVELSMGALFAPEVPTP